MVIIIKWQKIVNFTFLGAGYFCMTTDFLQLCSRAKLSYLKNTVIAGSRHIAYWVHIAYCILSAALSTASSFRIWNSSTGILSLPGASVRTPPMTKVMRKEARHTQRRDRASGVPLEILEHLPPKPESAYFLFCAFTYTSNFTGGCPPLPLSEKRVSLQLQLVIPGCDSV